MVSNGFQWFPRFTPMSLPFGGRYRGRARQSQVGWWILDFFLGTVLGGGGGAQPH